jgi:hypothetical protein
LIWDFGPDSYRDSISDLYTVMSSKIRQGLFNVIDSFTIKRRKEFYLIGILEEGEIKEGWFVHIPLNKSLAITCRISQIEDVEMSNGGGSYKLIVLPVFGNDPEGIDLWFGLNIGSELLDVTIDGERGLKGT